MTGLDFAKALGVALLLMALNVAASFGVMWVYGTFIEPGHPQAYYEAAAQRIAPWSSLYIGALLFLAAGWVFAKRRQTRNGVAFAVTFAGFYIAIDFAILIAVASLAAFAPIVAASMVTKLLAAMGGAYLARRRT